MKYQVICMPKDCKVPVKTFNTYEEAENYIKKHLCAECLRDLKRGYAELEYLDENEMKKDIIKIEKPSDTFCGAEFLIQEVK